MSRSSVKRNINGPPALIGYCRITGVEDVVIARESLVKNFIRLFRIIMDTLRGNMMMDFICEIGHLWSVAIQDIKKGQWCMLCNTGCERARPEFYELVKSKNGKVEGIYYNNRSRLCFTCIKGHKWEAYAFSIKTGTWCPHCQRSKGDEPGAQH